MEENKEVWQDVVEEELGEEKRRAGGRQRKRWRQPSGGGACVVTNLKNFDLHAISPLASPSISCVAPLPPAGSGREVRLEKEIVATVVSE